MGENPLQLVSNWNVEKYFCCQSSNLARFTFLRNTCPNLSEENSQNNGQNQKEENSRNNHLNQKEENSRNNNLNQKDENSRNNHLNQKEENSRNNNLNQKNENGEKIPWAISASPLPAVNLNLNPDAANPKEENRKSY